MPVKNASDTNSRQVSSIAQGNKCEKCIRECKTYVEWTGMAISSWPKNSFWNPSEPGFIIPATEGVSLPELKGKKEKEKYC